MVNKIAGGERLLWITVDGYENVLNPGETHGFGAMRLWHLAEFTPYNDAIVYGLAKGAVRVSEHWRQDTSIQIHDLRSTVTLIKDYLATHPVGYEVIIEWKAPTRGVESFNNSEEALNWLDNSMR